MNNLYSFVLNGLIKWYNTDQTELFKAQMEEMTVILTQVSFVLHWQHTEELHVQFQFVIKDCKTVPAVSGEVNSPL